MHWRYKAALQSLIARLPYSESLYYFVQRTFGGLRRSDALPVQHYSAARKIVQYVHETGAHMAGARVLEVGTGRKYDLPTALWLCGAGEIFTVDLHRYLKPSLVEEVNEIIADQAGIVLSVLGESNVHRERLRQLTEFKGHFRDFETLTNIHYIAPADATSLPFDSNIFDLHLSRSVLEHIAEKTLHALLLEAQRLLKVGGLLCHVIDPSDHFAHDDPSISSVNFLQFSDGEWEKIAGNQFMYHNRLRAMDYVGLVRDAGFEMVQQKRFLDENALQVLRSGLRVNSRFQKTPLQELAMREIHIVARNVRGN